MGSEYWNYGFEYFETVGSEYWNYGLWILKLRAWTIKTTGSEHWNYGFGTLKQWALDIKTGVLLAVCWHYADPWTKNSFLISIWSSFLDYTDICRISIVLSCTVYCTVYASILYLQLLLILYILSELGKRHFFSFATTTTRQLTRASMTRKNKDHFKFSVYKWSSHNEYRHYVL